MLHAASHTASGLRLAALLFVGTCLWPLGNAVAESGHGQPGGTDTPSMAVLRQAVLPSVATTRYVLQDFAATIKEPLTIDIRLTVDSRSPQDPIPISFVCPDEFGDACDLLVEPILALGGTCEKVLGNTVCDPPPPGPQPE